MKILSISVLASPKSAGQPAVVLASASDVSSFGFFQRARCVAGDSGGSSVGGRTLTTTASARSAGCSVAPSDHSQFLTFMSKTVAERTTPGQRQSVQENTHTAHCYSRVAPDSITGVIVTDEEYPVRPAFTLLNKLLDDFVARVPRAQWQSAADAARAESKPRVDGVDFVQINDYLVKYQDPRQADAIMKVQQELDETKIVLVRRSCLSTVLIPLSTRRSSRSSSAGRSSTRWSRRAMRSRPKVRPPSPWHR